MVRPSIRDEVSAGTPMHATPVTRIPGMEMAFGVTGPATLITGTETENKQSVPVNVGLLRLLTYYSTYRTVRGWSCSHCDSTWPLACKPNIDEMEHDEDCPVAQLRAVLEAAGFKCPAEPWIDNSPSPQVLAIRKAVQRYVEDHPVPA